MSQISYLKKLYERYNGRNIEFVNICINGTEYRKRFKNLIAKDQRFKDCSGLQLLSDRGLKSDFMKTMEINSIPRFILIGPDGKIVDADAKRPSDPALQAQLDALLK